jgi:hypothetical protein
LDPETIRNGQTDANYTFVFFVSTGHCGTTFFGQQSTWRHHLGPGKNLQTGFTIAHEDEIGRDTVKTLAKQATFCEDGLEYVVEKKIPKMVSVLKARRQHTYVGTGHQVILGILPALADTLQSNAKFVRLRRSRLDTAYSYALKGAGPCHLRCKLCICNSALLARCPVAADFWEKLTVFQQYLWFVDEVECQWQALVSSRPAILELGGVLKIFRV